MSKSQRLFKLKKNRFENVEIVSMKTKFSRNALLLTIFWKKRVTTVITIRKNFIVHFESNSINTNLLLNIQILLNCKTKFENSQKSLKFEKRLTTKKNLKIRKRKNENIYEKFEFFCKFRKFVAKFVHFEKFEIDSTKFYRAKIVDRKTHENKNSQIFEKFASTIVKIFKFAKKKFVFNFRRFTKIANFFQNLTTIFNKCAKKTKKTKAMMID